MLPTMHNQVPRSIAPPTPTTTLADSQEKEEHKKRNTKRGSLARSWLNVDVDDSIFLDLELLVLTFCIGMQDVATFLDYRCFASNQTGNSVLLAAGIVGLGDELFEVGNVGTSLAAFVAGGFCAGQTGNFILDGGVLRKRWWLVFSSIVQTAMVFGAWALQYRQPIHADGVAMTVIALLAFSSGAQVAMARGLRITEITTAMATAAWVDIIVDPELWTRKNKGRNRRLAFLISLISGAFVGAWAYRSMGSAFVLLVSAIGKVIITAALLINDVLVITCEGELDSEACCEEV